MKYYYFVSFAHETIQKFTAKCNGYGNREIVTAERIKSKNNLDKIEEIIEQNIVSINNADKVTVVILNYIWVLHRKL